MCRIELARVLNCYFVTSDRRLCQEAETLKKGKVIIARELTVQ